MDKELQTKIIKTIQFECLTAKDYLIKYLTDLDLTLKQKEIIDESFDNLIKNLNWKIEHPEGLEN